MTKDERFLHQFNILNGDEMNKLTDKDTYWMYKVFCTKDGGDFKENHYYERDSTGYNMAFDDLMIFRNTLTEVKTINETGQISLYPNPVKGIITINFSGNQGENMLVFIIDLSGREIKKIAVKKTALNYQLDISELQEGIYFAKIK